MCGIGPIYLIKPEHFSLKILLRNGNLTIIKTNRGSSKLLKVELIRG